MSSKRKICVAQFGAPHGVKGHLRLMSFCEPAGNVLGYQPLENQDGKPFSFTVIKMASSKGKPHFVVSVDGITSPEQAKMLTNMQLFADRDALDLVEEEGTFYNADLVGLTVLDPAGKTVGTVKEMHDFGAGSIVEVALPSGKTDMISFADQIESVDLDQGTMTLAEIEIVEVKDEQ